MELFTSEVCCQHLASKNLNPIVDMPQRTAFTMLNAIMLRPRMKLGTSCLNIPTETRGGVHNQFVELFRSHIGNPLLGFLWRNRSLLRRPYDIALLTEPSTHLADKITPHYEISRETSISFSMDTP
jgi:hypothetical protein